MPKPQRRNKSRLAAIDNFFLTIGILTSFGVSIYIFFTFVSFIDETRDDHKRLNVLCDRANMVTIYHPGNAITTYDTLCEPLYQIKGQTW